MKKERFKQLSVLGTAETTKYRVCEMGCDVPDRDDEFPIKRFELPQIPISEVETVFRLVQGFLGFLGVPKFLFENQNGLAKPIRGEHDFLRAYCASRGYVATSGLPDETNAEHHKSGSSDDESSEDDEGEDEPELDHALEDFNSFDMANGLATKKKVAVRKPTAPHKQHKKTQEKGLLLEGRQ